MTGYFWPRLSHLTGGDRILSSIAFVLATPGSFIFIHVPTDHPHPCAPAPTVIPGTAAHPPLHFVFELFFGWFYTKVPRPLPAFFLGFFAFFFFFFLAFFGGGG